MQMQRTEAIARRYAWTHKLPFFYGWVVVFLGAFSMFATTPGQSDSFSLFMNFFVNDFGWSRTFVSSLYSGATLLSGFLMFFVGRLVDRIGSKRVAMLSATVLGVACVLLSFVVSPVMLFGGFFLARLAGKGSLDLSAATLAPQWFISRRAFAIMLVGLGSTLGGIVFPLVNSYLITAFGWRIAFRFLAGGLWLIYVPVMFFFLINRPEDVGMLPDNAARRHDEAEPAPVDIEEPCFKQAQAVRTSAFWILTFAIFQFSLVGTGVILHFVSMLELQGFSMTFAAAIIGIRPLIGLVTTVLAGLVLDRIRRHHVVLAVGCILQVLGYVMLAFLQTATMAYLYAVFAGIGGALIMMCVSVLNPNLFGRRYLGGILGVIAALNVVGSAIGPIIFGAAFDLLHGYREIILISAILPLLAAVLSFFIRKPRARVLETG